MPEPVLIDTQILEKEQSLNSRRSIFLLSVLCSPFMGFVLFSLNLIKVGKRKSIMGYLLYLTWSFLFVSFPFFGFEFGRSLTFSLSGRIILAMFLIGPLWKRCFGQLGYSEKFPWSKFIMLSILRYSFVAAPLILKYFEEKGYELAFSIPSLGGYMVFMLLTLLVIAYLIFLVLKRIWLFVKQKMINR